MNNPADTLAALAESVLAARSHLGARRPDERHDPEDAKQWDDLTAAAAALASLKGEAVAVGVVRRSADGPHGVLYAALLPPGPKTPEVKEGDALYTTPPAPQAAGEDHERDEVLVLLAELARALPPISVEQPAIQHMIQKNRREQALQRIGDFILHKATTPTPSPAPQGASYEDFVRLATDPNRKPAPQGGGECETCDGLGYVVRYHDPYKRGDVSSPEDVPCPDCATPPAQQPGEVGEADYKEAYSRMVAGAEKALDEIEDAGPKALKYAAQEIRAALQSADAALAPKESHP